MWRNDKWNIPYSDRQLSCLQVWHAYEGPLRAVKQHDENFLLALHCFRAGYVFDYKKASMVCQRTHKSVAGNNANTCVNQWSTKSWRIIGTAMHIVSSLLPPLNSFQNFLHYSLKLNARPSLSARYCEPKTNKSRKLKWPTSDKINGKHYWKLYV